MAEALEQIESEIRQQVTPDQKVFLMVSGGVDSSVAFALLARVLGEDRIHGLFVDTGMLRLNEAQTVPELLATADLPPLHIVDAGEQFLSNLEGIAEPERKRAIIGETFLQVQREYAQSIGLDGPEWLLGQGTIYPDHIETGGSEHASTIKTHHNRVPEIEALIAAGRIVEPLKDLYKDEVRALGTKIGLPRELLMRHPFPGPGLGVRILCQDTAITEPSDELHLPYLARILPLQSVGVQGDARSYRSPLAVQVEIDNLPELHQQAAQIVNQIESVNRIIAPLHQLDLESLVSYPNKYMTPERIVLLQQADDIVQRALGSRGLPKIWQFPVILAPIGSNGDESIILRPIMSEEAMTAEAVLMPRFWLQQVTAELLQLEGIGAVFLDLTSKPPGTIEWE